MLTDLVIPACNDLASLCIDSWVQSEEVDGQRLVVTTDIGYRSLVLNDLMPPPICRYLKVSSEGDGECLVGCCAWNLRCGSAQVMLCSCDLVLTPNVTAVLSTTSGRLFWWGRKLLECHVEKHR